MGYEDQTDLEHELTVAIGIVAGVLSYKYPSHRLDEAIEQLRKCRQMARDADRLAHACAKAIMRGDVRTRSAIDDALFDYLCVGDGPKDVPSWVDDFEREQSA